MATDVDRTTVERSLAWPTQATALVDTDILNLDLFPFVFQGRLALATLSFWWEFDDHRAIIAVEVWDNRDRRWDQIWSQTYPKGDLVGTDEEDLSEWEGEQQCSHHWGDLISDPPAFLSGRILLGFI